MRENRLSGSEGGGVANPTLPTPIQGAARHPLSTVFSKLKLKGELHRPRSANLVERIETATRATGPQTAAERLRRVTEQRAGQVVIGTAEVWVVKDIEKLRSESKPDVFGNVKLTL